MPNTTPNLSLLKPTSNEFFDLEHQNTNMDLIDEAISNLQEKQTVMNTSTILTTGWVANTGDNALKLTLPLAGVLSTDWVEVIIDKNYHDVAQAAELNPTTDEYDGGIIIYANTAPTVEIPIRYKVVK